MEFNVIELVKEKIGDSRIVRINPLWVEVNEHQFGHARNEVLIALNKLGYKKRHVMLYDGEGNKNTLICYVQDGFTPADKPLIGDSVSTKELNERFAKIFLDEVKEMYLQEDCPEWFKIDPPFCDINLVDDHLVGFFTREVLHKLVTKMWFEKGRCTKKGVGLIVRTVEQMSEQTYMRKNTYRKNDKGEHRARIEDKLIYKYIY